MPTETSAVIDTNVIISALLSPAGNCAEILEDVMNGTIQAYVSETTLAELQDVLARAPFKRYRAQSQQLLRLYRKATREIQTNEQIDAEVSEQDKPFLACSKQAAADYLITGDKELLSLGTYQDTRIIAPHEFLTEHRETTHSPQRRSSPKKLTRHENG